jgi:hypothetical protein
VLALAIAAHRPFLALTHLGWDTYPLILSSRVSSAADLLGVFSEELMDGLYPHGRFYRPLTTLSFALDHALFGLASRGYHATDLALLLACTLALAGLVRRLLGPGAAGAVAALWFALHPLHVETLPVAARRADVLAQLFTLLALVAMPAAPSATRRWAAALFAALALGAKETGILALPLLLALRFAEPGGEGPVRRLRAASRECALPAAAVALVLLLRSLVLGGLGGHPESSLLAGTARGLALAPVYAWLLLMPQPLLADATLARGLVAAAALALIAVLPRVSGRTRRRPLLWVCATWLLGVLLLNGIAGEVASWYAYAALPPGALLVGALAAGAARADGSGRGARAVAAATALLLLVMALRYSPLLHAYPDWQRVSEGCVAYLDRVRAAAAGAPPGAVRSVPDLPVGLASPLERVGVRSALGLAPYSVEAWAALALEGPPLFVVVADAARPAAARADGIVIETRVDPSLGLLP